MCLLIQKGDFMYKNYVFDLYGTLVDLNAGENDDNLWQKMAIDYGYKGAN